MATELPQNKEFTNGKDASRSCSLATSQSSSLPRNLAISFKLLQQNIVSTERQRNIKSQMSMKLIFTVLVRQGKKFFPSACIVE
jgi:hypothetical protein